MGFHHRLCPSFLPFHSSRLFISSCFSHWLNGFSWRYFHCLSRLAFSGFHSFTPPPSGSYRAAFRPAEGWASSLTYQNGVMFSPGFHAARRLEDHHHRHSPERRFSLSLVWSRLATPVCFPATPTMPIFIVFLPPRRLSLIFRHYHQVFSSPLSASVGMSHCLVASSFTPHSFLHFLFLFLMVSRHCFHVTRPCSLTGYFLSACRLPACRIVFSSSASHRGLALSQPLPSS